MRFPWRRTAAAGKATDRQAGWFGPPRLAERSCCCPARPVVVVLIPPASARRHPVDLLLCGHHYLSSKSRPGRSRRGRHGRDRRDRRPSACKQRNLRFRSCPYRPATVNRSMVCVLLSQEGRREFGTAAGRLPSAGPVSARQPGRSTADGSSPCCANVQDVCYLQIGAAKKLHLYVRLSRGASD